MAGDIPLPRYFFHTGGAAPFSDSVGLNLEDDDAAWSNAVRYMGELLQDIDGKMPDRALLEVIVADEENRTVITLRIAGDREAESSAPPQLATNLD